MYAKLAVKSPAFNENPTTDKKDGKYRLFTRTQLSFCCNGNKLSSFKAPTVDKEGGLEIKDPGIGVFGGIGGIVLSSIFDLSIYGTINMSKVNFKIIDLSRVNISWIGWGRPNKLAEPSIQWVAKRTSVNIWHIPSVDIYCENGTGYYEVKKFRGSAFPSRKLWVNGIRKKDIAQKGLANLWDAYPKAKTFVKE